MLKEKPQAAERSMEINMEEKKHEICITDTAATIGRLLGLEEQEGNASPIGAVLEYADKSFAGEKCDRIFMYNPDAVAFWIYEKYKDEFRELERQAKLRLAMRSVFPPVTPVCFASMYSGDMPKQHGITKYEKPVLKIETIFDRLIRAGKKPAIVSTEGDSISKIFLEREMDYYIYSGKEECNQKALSLIREDRHDLIVLYNGDYDYYMHRFGPEGRRPLRALKENIRTYGSIYKEAEKNWKKHNSVIAFAPDHGCHKSRLLFGSHGIDAPCDMNIPHFYGFIPGEDNEGSKVEK